MTGNTDIGRFLFWEKLVECFSDDGEKFGGERILKVLREQNAVDVLSVCCRWVGVHTFLSQSHMLISYSMVGI